jgi:hypothetical protein
MQGTTYKRCKCPVRRNAAGKRLACPKKHGTWSYVVDVPLSDAGRREHARQQITRGGFASQTLAVTELRQAIRLLEIPGTDDDAGRLEIVSSIRDHYRRYQQLPDYADVRRRFGAGVSLTMEQTTGEWLDEWMGGKRKLAANTRRSYAGFIRLPQAPAR